MRAFATAVLLAAAAAVFAQQSTPQQPQTFTGCLTSANNVYTLTVADPPVPGATAQTTAFTLKPSGTIDLKSHVNQKVEVKGNAVSTDDAARVVEKSSSQATGTSGSNGTQPKTGGVTPRVETSAKAQIVAQTLTVSAIKEVSSKCDPLAK
jgi:hypothetical protein